MLPQEIRDIIKKEAEELAAKAMANSGEANPRDWELLEPKIIKLVERCFITGATKYAELMIEFAEWVDDKYFKVHPYEGSWKWMKLGGLGSDFFTTSDLLTIFLKEKSNPANL